MKQITTIMLAVVVAALGFQSAVASDLGNRDVLRLTDTRYENGEYRVAVLVVNDQELAAMDIPLRFGQPGDAIYLDRVEWAARVQDWDFTHAAIDNESKTVILGLISELVGVRPNANLKAAAQNESKVADLVFKVDGDFEADFATFKTERPGHELTYIYNLGEGENLQVVSFAPEFEVDASFKGGVTPTEYALSQNYPNPFNPSTSFTLSLPEATDYSVRIFNVAGQLVKTIDGHVSSAEKVTIKWDGTNNRGAKVSSGMYFYRAEAKDFEETRKMLMLK
jgi:hypothetical protein